jgi:hypothetical protein
MPAVKQVFIKRKEGKLPGGKRQDRKVEEKEEEEVVVETQYQNTDDVMKGLKQGSQFGGRGVSSSVSHACVLCMKTGPAIIKMGV